MSWRCLFQHDKGTQERLAFKSDLHDLTPDNEGLMALHGAARIGAAQGNVTTSQRQHGEEGNEGAKGQNLDTGAQ